MLGVVVAMGIGGIVGVVCGKGGRYGGSTRDRRGQVWRLVVDGWQGGEVRGWGGD